MVVAAASGVERQDGSQGDRAERRTDQDSNRTLPGGRTSLSLCTIAVISQKPLLSWVNASKLLLCCPGLVLSLDWRICNVGTN